MLGSSDQSEATNWRENPSSVMILSLTDFLSVSDPAKVWQRMDQERVEMERVMRLRRSVFCKIFPQHDTFTQK